MSYKIMYDGDGGHNLEITNNILVSAESDLSELPDTIPVGSIAFTAGFVYMWQKGLDGTWTAI